MLTAAAANNLTRKDFVFVLFAQHMFFLGQPSSFSSYFSPDYGKKSFMILLRSNLFMSHRYANINPIVKLPEVKLRVSLQTLVEAQQQRDEDAGHYDVAQTQHREVTRVQTVHQQVLGEHHCDNNIIY